MKQWRMKNEEMKFRIVETVNRNIKQPKVRMSKFNLNGRTSPCHNRYVATSCRYRMGIGDISANKSFNDVVIPIFYSFQMGAI
jgi:hypothetical protein